MADDELVSVVIPTHYRNDGLDAAIRSVRRQRHDPVEVVVVDDSGEGHARSVVETFGGVEYVAKEENEGPQVARDDGLDAASGAFVQFLDDDDELDPGKLGAQVECFRGAPEVGVVYCGMVLEATADTPERTVSPDPSVRGDVLEAALRFEMPACVTSTMLIRRPVLDELRPLNRYRGATDDVMKIRLARATEFDFVPEPLVYRGQDAEGSLGRSMTAVEGRKRLLREFRDLYDHYPQETRDVALAATYRHEGHVRLRERAWSPAAVGAFARALYHAPGVPPRDVGALVAAALGRPGYRAATRLAARLRDSPPDGTP